MDALPLRLLVAALGLSGLVLSQGCSCADESESKPPSTAQCGDGVVEGSETCDDGNTDDGDGCSAVCAEETSVCGDGVVEGGEQCDDGNTDDGDGCSASCQDEPAGCGDGVIDEGETCDDGNEVAFDGCEPDCTETPYEVICADLAPLSSGTCEVTAGGSETLIVGDILHPHTIFRGGQVLVDAGGAISCVGCDCAATDATIISCPTGVVSPGLINAHDHISFIQNDPYTDSGERYEHRHDWREGLNGHTEINASGGASDNQKLWGELRFLIGGATATIGSGEVEGFLRNLDRFDQQEGLNQPEVHYETFPLGDASGTQLASGCGYGSIDTKASIASDDAYFPHIAEGINAFARNEFLCVSSEDIAEDLLEPQSAFIHSVGLTPIDYARMADQGTSLVWSPRSNITLYGDTAVVQVAHRLGVNIALGTDWMPTGSMNVQRELKCADGFNQDYLDGYFDDRELWRMVTSYAAQAAAMDDAIGVLEVGRVADIAIFDAATSVDYRAVIDALPQDTVLVMRSGVPLYGDETLISAIATGSCDVIDVCGASKQLCAQDDIQQTYPTLEAAVGGIYPLLFCSGNPTDEPSCTPMRPASVEGSTIYTGDTGVATDPDGDGIEDSSDNCPDVFNPIRPVDMGVQADFDVDGLGDSCDPCPLDADNNACGGFNAADLDADGVLNGDDNCPEVPNDTQDDGDTDGKGDACDDCDDFSNPGDGGCPASIYDIKQGTVGGTVAVLNRLVTGCSDGNGFFLQVKDGDVDYLGNGAYAGAAHSGVFVYHPTVACGTTVTVGDRVSLQPASAGTFFGQVQLSNVTVSVEASAGESPPPAVVLDPATVAGDVATEYEGVIVEVQNVLVTDIAPQVGPGDSAPTIEFVVTGGLLINDLMYLTAPFPVVSAAFPSISGIVDYRNGNQKLEPRDAADVVAGPPQLVAFGPAPAFVREGQMDVGTIPTPLEVTLSSIVASQTFVPITSNDETSVTVAGGGVTVPAGSSSAPVVLSGLQQALSVQLTATLTTALNADVRVIGSTEVPSVVSITPAMGIVAPNEMLGLEVFLDIPAAPTTGSDVLMSLSPGTFGSVSASVNVPADQLSQTFMFTAGASEGSEMLTATLNGTQMADITIQSGSGLVINEVDYDQPMTDSDEFVEIFNNTSSTIDLTNLSLVLVNGNGDTEYDRVDLSPAVSLAGGEYLVVGSATALALVPGGVKTIQFTGASNNVENGAPDGLCILDTATSTIIDALSYEGAITAATLIGVTAPVNLVEGNAVAVSDDNTTPTSSLSRLPNGSDTDDANTDWAFTTHTPGTANM